MMWAVIFWIAVRGPAICGYCDSLSFLEGCIYSAYGTTSLLILRRGLLKTENVSLQCALCSLFLFGLLLINQAPTAIAHAIVHRQSLQIVLVWSKTMSLFSCLHAEKNKSMAYSWLKVWRSTLYFHLFHFLARIKSLQPVNVRVNNRSVKQTKMRSIVPPCINIQNSIDQILWSVVVLHNAYSHIYESPSVTPLCTVTPLV